MVIKAKILLNQQLNPERKYVLDIGCGYGKCGQILKSKGAEKVDGIEISKKAYQEANPT